VWYLYSMVDKVKLYFYKDPVTSEEEREALGDDSKGKHIAVLIRSYLCKALACIFGDQFKSFKLFGRHHVWDFIEAAAGLTTSVGNLSALSLTSNCKTIATDTSFSDSNMKFRTFICVALTKKQLTSWINILLQNQVQCRRFYNETAVLLTATDMILDALSVLNFLPFHLSSDFEIRTSLALQLRNTN